MSSFVQEKQELDLQQVAEAQSSDERRLAELYQKAKDENELLEFKNYELLFKIQELEQNQRQLHCNQQPTVHVGPNKLAGEQQTAGTLQQATLTRAKKEPPTTNAPVAALDDVQGSLIGLRSAGSSKVATGDKNGGQVDSSCHQERSMKAGEMVGEGRTLARFAAAEAELHSELASLADLRQQESSLLLLFNSLSRKALSAGDPAVSERPAAPSSAAGSQQPNTLVNHLGQHENTVMGHASRQVLTEQQLDSLEQNEGTNKSCCGISELHETKLTDDHAKLCIMMSSLAEPIAQQQKSIVESEPHNCSPACQQLIEYNATTERDLPSSIVGGDQLAKVMTRGELPKVDQHGNCSLFKVDRQPEQVDQSRVSADEMETTKRQQQVAGSKRGSARIAVPVLARQQHPNGPDRSVARRSNQQVAPGESNYLRTRSKSSLGTQPNELASSSLASKRCQSQAVLFHSSSLPRQIKRPQATQSNKTNRGRQETLKAASDKRMDSKESPSSAIVSSSESNGTQSSGRASSGRMGAGQQTIVGFVTLIPTLISQSHAATTPASSSRTTNGNNSTGAPNRPRSSSSSSSLIVSSEAIKSPAVANRRPVASQRRPGRFVAGAQQQPTALKRDSKSMSNLVAGDFECIDDHASSAAAEGPAASNDKSASMEERDGSVEKHESCESSLVSSPTIGDHTSIQRDAMHQINGQSIDDQHQSGCKSPEATNDPSIIDNSAKQIGDQTRDEETPSNEGRTCEQCKLLQSKLSQLLEDREQLCEQINELEEMENDSRLMSQKLAKQLLNIELQFDICKCELKRAHDNGSRLQFQNKRLNFELQLRMDVNQRLQGQLSRLQSDLIKANNGSDQKVATSLETPTSDEKDHLPPGRLDFDKKATAQSEDPQLATDHESSNDRVILRGEERQAQVVADNAPELPKESAEDSAYSKSSASSDDASNTSEDGYRSDAEHAANLGSQETAGLQSATIDGEPSSGEPENQKLRTNSSSSSGDESDHLEVVGGLAASDQTLALQQTNGNRQQVHRKKTSTARILRGIQVQQSSAVTSNKMAASQPTANTGWSISNIGQARLAKVVTDSDSSQNQSLESTTGEPAAVGIVERVLEGVDNIEQGRTDDILRSLIDRRPTKEPEPTLKDDRAAIEAQQQVEQLRLEVASLKMRLVQARTLNDNLVSELKSNKDRLDQLRSCSQECQPADGKQQAMARQRSVVQINNSGHNNSVQVATTTLVECKHRSGLGCCSYCIMDSHHGQQTIACTSQQPGPEDHHHCAGRMGCVSLNEIIEFLRFLLDKVHSHHGRTFDLVNDCQRLATSALLVSYSHQMNLIHHSSAVMAGNQLIDQLATNNSDQQPLRPPPRRQRQQSPGKREVNSNSQQQVAIEQQAKQPSGGRAYVALQVAKQTLFSIVPIYYNNNSNSKRTQAVGEERDNDHPAKVKRSVGVSSITGRLTKSKSWIVLNKSSNGSESNGKTDYGDERSRRNVSVLKIGATKSVDNLNQSDSAKPQCNNAQSKVDLAQQARFMKAKSSLNEDIERYRVHFNGQLLDLLTRQNWCENMIAEKLKYYQSSRQVKTQPTLMCQQRVSNANSRPRDVELLGANMIANKITKSTQIPVNTVSLDPKGHYQQQSCPWPENKQNQLGGSLC